MKIYLSGKITGLPQQEAREKFADAQALLEEIGLETVNPMEKGLSNELSWEQHMVKDIEMLLGCDGILMLDNWETSDGAMIERYIAEKKGMDIWHEVPFKEKQKFVSNVKAAVYETTGLSFKEYTTKSRQRDAFFARMLFAKQCHKVMKPIEIANLINRDRTTVMYLLKVYKDEIKYNPHFRELAKNVSEKLAKQGM